MKATSPPALQEPPFSVRDPFLIGSSKATHITLVRHGQQQYPVSHVFTHGDWVDPHLSDIGRLQAVAVASALKGEPIDALYSSTLSRAFDTAVAIGEPHGLTPVRMHELREIESYRDIGADENPADLIPEAEWIERQRRFRLERRWDLMPFGEPAAEFRARSLAAINGLADEHRGKHIVIVVHGGVINAYLSEVLGTDEDLFFLPTHTAISRVALDHEIRVIRSINEHQHLGVDLLTY
jgi:2,3-bisphosphoglycerate-dependent phosphoglycerate mutase